MEAKKEPLRKAEFYMNGGKPMGAVKIGRNQKCECGSGKKAKNCCGTKTRYFARKVNVKFQE